MIEINNRKLCESCFSEINTTAACPHCGYNESEYMPDPMVLPPGTKLNNKIIIGRVMGKGGFGITYLGYDTRMDKTIAVKEYFPNGISYRAPNSTEVTVADAKSTETFESGAEKFYNEAQMVSQFNGNPNIVSVYDYFRANSTVYLIMEYLSGITLKNYVKKHGRLTDGQALYIMDKIVAALIITHSAGVLHRDISPDNIMICSDGKIKLIDFGAARQILTESSSNLTVVMKPGYTPIEQYTKKGRQGAWTDIYSLGVSVYYALTKSIIDDPYARMDNDEEFAENKYKINESLWIILKKCTMINSADRYGSAIDLRKALKSVSAPLTAEVIKLSDDDLKSGSEEKEDAAAHTTAAQSDDTLPVTTENVTPVVEEEIEIFESSESAAGTDSVSDTADVGKTADETNKQLASPKKKRTIAAVCFAAAIAIAAVICIIFGINKQKTPDASSSDDGIIYSSFYPEMKDGKLFFEMDSSYPESGCGKQISRENFLRFDGDVKVTLELEHLLSQYDGDCLYMTDVKGQDPEIMALNTGMFNEVDQPTPAYSIVTAQKQFTFVISRSSIEKMSGSMKFIVWNLYVRTAVLEAYDPTEYEPADDAVIVNINSREREGLSNFIPLDILESFDSDIKITLDIKYEKTDGEYDSAYISACNASWDRLAIKVDNNHSLPWAPKNFYHLGSKNVTDKFIFILPKSEISKLDANGLCFDSSNLYIKSAALEASA